MPHLPHSYYHHVKDRVTEGRIKMEFVPGVENQADCLTKPLSPQPFELCVQNLGLKSIQVT